MLQRRLRMAPSVTWSLVLVLALVLVVSAQSLDPSVVDLETRISDFSTRLYRCVSERSDENVLLAPPPLVAGLLALLSASGGPTQDQLVQSLSLTGVTPSTIPDLFQTLRDSVLKEGLKLDQGLALLPPQDFQAAASYIDLVQNKFGGSVQTLPYTDPPEALDRINRWASDQTGDQVKDLLTQLPPQTELLLASVASYQVRFAPPFNSSSTLDERFFVDSYHTVMVPMMLRADKYHLTYDPSVKAGVLKLPMADGSAMLVVLPDEDVDIGTVEGELTAEKIRGWIRQLKKTRLEVQFPRFQMTASYTLKDLLQVLGVTLVFQDDGDITTMGGAKGPKVSQVLHKSVVVVDETTDDITSEGGAPTFNTPPPRLTFNRPFLFVVYHQGSGSLLLLGRVSDPSRK